MALFYLSITFFCRNLDRVAVKMSAAVWTVVAILAMLAVTGSGSSEKLNPFLTEQEAHSFVASRRYKRFLGTLFANLEEECAHEGCDFEEVKEWDRSTSEAQEYMMTLACRLWPCSTGYRCQGVRQGTSHSGGHWRECNAVCFGSTSCPHGGHCSRPNFCSGCDRGYDSPRCADVDECADRRTCDDHATCANTDGSYTCRCAPGYVGDGHSCTDVDECADSHTCDDHATCTNTEGSYTCRCAPGYVGDGHTCTAVTTTVQPTTSTTTSEKTQSTEIKTTTTTTVKPTTTSSTQEPVTTTTTTTKPTTSETTTPGKASSGDKPVVVQTFPAFPPEMTQTPADDPEVLGGAAELSDVCGDDEQQPCGKRSMPAVERIMLIMGTVAFVFACGMAYTIYRVRIKNNGGSLVFLPSWLGGSRPEPPLPPPPTYSEGNTVAVAKVNLPPNINIDTYKEGPSPGNEYTDLPLGKEIHEDPVKIPPRQEADVTDVEFVLKSAALGEKAPMN